MCGVFVLSMTTPGRADEGADLPTFGPIAPPDSASWHGGIGDQAAYAGQAALYDVTYLVTSPTRITTRQALFWGGVLALGGVAYHYDQEILDGIRDSRDLDGLRWFHELGSFVEPAGHMGNMNRFYFGGLALSYVAGQDRATRIFAEILESHFLAGLGKNLAQGFAGRLRPSVGQGPESWGNDDATSFPSGHAINIFQLATVLSHHADRWWFTTGAYLVASSVAVQRVESRAHWASDVIVSAAWGTMVARTVVRLHDRYGGPCIEPMVTASGPGLGMGWRF